jgi:hypothetical protein
MRAVIAIVLALCATGCKWRKSAQCEALISRANETVTARRYFDEKVTAASKAPCREIPLLVNSTEQCDAEERRSTYLALMEGSDKLSYDAAALEKIPLSDAKIVSFRAALAKNLKDMSAVARDGGALFDEKRKKPASESELAAITKREIDLNESWNAVTDEVNAYCGSR